MLPQLVDFRLRRSDLFLELGDFIEPLLGVLRFQLLGFLQPLPLLIQASKVIFKVGQEGALLIDCFLQFLATSFQFPGDHFQRSGLFFQLLLLRLNHLPRGGFGAEDRQHQNDDQRTDGAKQHRQERKQRRR